MRESKLERYFVEQVEKHGGMAEKFTSPGRRFVPDRIVSWPWFKVHFVELKAPDGKLSPGQKRDHERRYKSGQSVFVLWTKEHIDSYIRICSP